VALRSQHLTATGPGRRGSRLCHPRWAPPSGPALPRPRPGPGSRVFTHLSTQSWETLPK